MRFRTRTALLAIVMPAASAAFAGTVDVSFVNRTSYIDAGSTKWTRTRT